MSWPGNCMLPRRCPPSWLGWQLHVNGGYWVGAGLVVALLASSVRALLGGLARAFLWHAVVPGKDLAGGLVAFLAEGYCLSILT